MAIPDHPKAAARVPKAKTLAGYARKYGQLKRAAITALQNSDIAAFIDWVIETRRKRWSASSWRQYRAAIVYGLRQEAFANPATAAQVAAACNRLEETRPWRREEKRLRTSQQKSKRLPRGDYDRVRYAALASRSRYRHELADVLLGSTRTGLRMAEWPTARLIRSERAGFAWEMVVRNAKFDEVRHEQARAHGEFRTLRWVELDDETVGAITRWIARAKQAEREGMYEQLVRALSDFMRGLTEDLFPRRKEHPTLYSARHEAIAIWKLHYVEPQTTHEGRLQGLAIVAALSGHATDESATAHYGRPRRGERLTADFPIANADDEEVARIRRRIQLSLERLADCKTRAQTHRSAP